MDVCGLSKARPMVCNDSPAFQRRHTSVRCATESSTRFPWAIDTTFEKKIHIRWCCIDPLRPPRLPDNWRNGGGVRDEPTQCLRAAKYVQNRIGCVAGDCCPKNRTALIPVCQKPAPEIRTFA